MQQAAGRLAHISVTSGTNLSNYSTEGATAVDSICWWGLSFLCSWIVLSFKRKAAGTCSRLPKYQGVSAASSSCSVPEEGGCQARPALFLQAPLASFDKDVPFDKSALKIAGWQSVHLKTSHSYSNIHSKELNGLEWTRTGLVIIKVNPFASLTHAQKALCSLHQSLV